jgi:dihydrofolate reductase
VKTAAASTGGTGSSAGAAWSPSVTTCSPRGWTGREAERAWQSWLDRLFAWLTEEVEMRRITAGLFITVDGVVESPDQWQEGYFNEEMGEAVGAGMAASDTMLLGRRTYEEFAGYWPHNPEADGADYMNNTPKLVVSTTLDTLAWQPATLIRGNLAEELTTLKQQPGKDIQVIGSGTLVGSLLREGLLDELSLLVHPVVVGRGKRLFQDGDAKVPLRLADSKTFSTGVLSLTYRPAGGE